jgi:hypothetical protein
MDSKETTRKTLIHHEHVPMNDYVYMKHTEGSFGKIKLADWLNNVYQFTDNKTEKVVVFDTVEDLINSGWVVD